MTLKIIRFLKTAWYWVFAGLLLFAYFVSKGHSFGKIFYFITSLLPVVIGTSYYVNHKLIPEFLLRGKNGVFILYAIYTIIISLYLQYLVIFIALIIFTSFQFGNPSLLSLNIGNLSLTMYLLVLIKVIIEIIQKLSEKETIIKSLENTKEFAEKIVIRYNRVNHSIFLSNILYIESLSDYIKVVTLDDEIVTKERISTINNRLPPYFKRIHRSFIINSQKVNSYNSEFIKVGGSQIPISRTYKKEIITYLNKK